MPLPPADPVRQETAPAGAAGAVRAGLAAVGLASFLFQPALSAAAPARVAAALADVDATLDRIVEDWIRIAEIPAPSGDEARRAAHVEGRMRRMGLERITRDEEGNVYGLVRGKDRSRRHVAFLAHMDTIASADTDHRVRRLPGGRLAGPGVRDDSSGLAAILAAAELIVRHGLIPPADTWFVATAKEEIGLHGAERFVADHAGELGAVIAVDGHLGQISYGATGIVWLKIHFLAPGGHTLRAHERASAVLAAARAIERIHAVPTRRSPESMETWLNIGMIGGGDVPNAQARDAWFTVDLRSNDPATFEALERRVAEIARETAREIGVTVEFETLHRRAGGGGPMGAGSRLAKAAREVLEELGWEAVSLTPRGTADHNVAIVRGIDGIAIGATTGGDAHTPGEFAEIPPLAVGVKQVLLLALRPLTLTQ